jgi:hypothetical protein
MKQTATDWMFEQLWETPKDKLAWFKILMEAKEMEREQLINGYADGINHDFTDLDIEFGIGNSDREYHAEKYYNQTYK